MIQELNKAEFKLLCEVTELADSLGMSLTKKNYKNSMAEGLSYLQYLEKELNKFKHISKVINGK